MVCDQTWAGEVVHLRHLLKRSGPQSALNGEIAKDLGERAGELFAVPGLSYRRMPSSEHPNSLKMEPSLGSTPYLTRRVPEPGLLLRFTGIVPSLRGAAAPSTQTSLARFSLNVSYCRRTRSLPLHPCLWRMLSRPSVAFPPHTEPLRSSSLIQPGVFSRCRT